MATGTKRAVPILKWSGRVLGTLSSLYWLSILILQGIFSLSEGGGFPSGEGLILFSLILLCSVAVGISWKWSKKGGVFTIVCGLALAVFGMISAGRNRLFAALVSGFPFLLAGILTTAAHQMENPEG